MAVSPSLHSLVDNHSAKHLQSTYGCIAPHHLCSIKAWSLSVGLRTHCVIILSVDGEDMALLDGLGVGFHQERLPVDHILRTGRYSVDPPYGLSLSMGRPYSQFLSGPSSVCTC